MAKMGDFGTFLDVTRLIGVVTRSNWVQIARNTSADVAKGLKWAYRLHFTLKSLLGCPENNNFDPKWPFLAFLRPLEASTGHIM